MLFKQCRLVGGRDRKRRGHRRNQIAQPIDRAPLDINAAQQRTLHGLQQGIGLRGGLNVAVKENHSAGLQQAQPGSFQGAQLRAFQPHYQNLAGR